MTHLRWADPPDADSRARVLKNEAKLRPLIPPVAAAEAAMWTAIADSGRMRGVREPNLEMCRTTARMHQDAANKEAATGNAAAAIMILRDLGFRGFPEDARSALWLGEGTGDMAFRWVPLSTSGSSGRAASYAASTTASGAAASAANSIL